MRVIDQEMFSNEILQDTSDKLYVVDFYAEWCGPCKMLTPLLSDLQTQYGSQIEVVKIDIDVNQELTEEYQIMSIPTVMIFRRGQKLETVNGLKGPEFRSPLIDSLLAASAA